MSGTARMVQPFSEGAVYLKQDYGNGYGEYEKLYSYDISKNTEIINAMYRAGIFSLDAEYRTDDTVMDGGSWSLEIIYADGTSKSSVGINSGPGEKFINADKAFYDLVGEEFFGAVPESYKAPPIPSLTFMQITENESIGYSLASLPSKKYVWRGKEYIAKDWFISKSPMDIDHSSDWEATVLFQPNSETEKFTSAEVYWYVGTEAAKAPVEFEVKKGKSIKFSLSPNQNYIIVIKFPSGSAEYRFNTFASSND